MRLIDRTHYLGMAVLCEGLYSLKLINKNHPLYHKKRDMAIKIIPDSKLLSEIAAVTHVLLHPLKKPVDIESVKKHVTMLLDEAKARNLKKNNVISWSEKMLEREYEDIESVDKEFIPDTARLLEFEKIVRKRTTNRYISKKRFPKKVLYRLIESAVQAPSSCDRQGWRFVIADKKEDIEKVSIIKKQPFIKNFPYIILCCFDKEVYMGTDTKTTPYLDCGGAIMNLCNAGVAIGLSACWLNFSIGSVGKNRHAEMRKLFNIPEKFVPVSLVGMGLPYKKTEKPPRENVNHYLPLEK